MTLHLVAIAWLYVTLLMALTETTIVRGVVTFLLYGAFPLSIVLYLLGTPARRKARRAREAAESISTQPEDPELLTQPANPASQAGGVEPTSAPEAFSSHTNAPILPVTPSRRNE